MKYIDNRLNANIVKLEDTNNNYASENVEGALEEIDSKIKEIVDVADLAQDGNNVYIKDSDGNKIGDGITIQVSSSENTTKPLKTVNMGEIFEQPMNYTAWPQGCFKYDFDTNCIVGIANAKRGHTSGTGKCYFVKIDAKTGEIFTPTIAGQYDDEDTYGCFTHSFYIDNSGNYIFFADIHQSNWTNIETRKYISTDKGDTWTYTVHIKPYGSCILLSSGRLIASGTVSKTGDCIMYSDDDGENWTEVTLSGISSMEIEIIEMKNCLIAIGRKDLTYTSKLPAVLYFSIDNGSTWSPGINSTTLTDMCNPCSGVYWENEDLLELFYCSRASNNGNTGTIYHAWATLNDAKNDKFTVEEIGESKQTSVGIDFGYCASVCNQKDKAWVIYYDKADSGSGVNLNLILCDKTCVTLPISNSINSLISLYSSKTIEDKIEKLRISLNNRINEIIISGGGTIPPSTEGGTTEGFYTLDGLKLCIDAKTSTNYSETGIKELISQTEATITPNVEGTAISELISDNGLSKSTLSFTLPTALNPDNGITIELTLNGSDNGTNLSILPENKTGSWANSFGIRNNDGSYYSDSYDYINTSNERKSNNNRSLRSLGDWSGFTHFILIIPSLTTIANTGPIGRFICNNVEMDNTKNWWGYTNFKSFLDDLVKEVTFNTGDNNLDNTLISLRIYDKELSLDEINANYNYEKNRS